MNNETKKLIDEAVKRLKSYERREYQGYIAIEYFEGNARKTESVMGWGREGVKLGMKEIETGIRCINRYKDTGRKRSEEKIETLSEDIRQIVDPQTQADPSMKSGRLRYTRITAKAVREALIKDKGYSDKELPCENTIGNILNRLGYNLKRVLKAKPAKKIKKVDEIFENVWRVNKESDENPKSLRISIRPLLKPKQE
jgi:hypothetical protein